MPRRPLLSPAALAAAAFLLLVVVRAATLAPDAWEWDEVLFVRSVQRGLDLRLGRPHAPGYPLFVEAARGLAALGVAPLRATVLTGFAGGLLAPAGLFALLAAFDVSIACCVLAGILYAFIPAVWLHGVRPLSDPPAAAAFLFSAAAFVAASRRKSARLLVAGAALAAAGFGIRPQAAVALLPLAGFAALAFWRRGRRRPIVLAFAVGLLGSALAYVPVVTGSGGWATFRDYITGQLVYVGTSDALRAADYSKAETWTRWFRDPFGPDALAIAFGLLSVAALFVATRISLALVAIFLPLFALTIPFSSLPAAPRYATVLLPLPAALAALALEGIRRRVALPGALLGAGLVGASALVGAPAVLEVAGHTSPPVAAFAALAGDVDLAGRPLLLWDVLMVHQEELLPKASVRLIPWDTPATVTQGELIVMGERVSFGQEPVRYFHFDEPLLARISRARYMAIWIYRGDPGVGVVSPRLYVSGTYDVKTGDTKLGTGGRLTVSGLVGPVVVSASAQAGPGTTLRANVVLNGETRSASLPSGGRAPLSMSATPGANGVLFEVDAIEGEVTLTHFRLSSAAETATERTARGAR